MNARYVDQSFIAGKEADGPRQANSTNHAINLRSERAIRKPVSGRTR
ncbi:hypothetical protein MesloDRAFT_1175 [Mesorhizobium japonicum R7A]|nr:hypothetical protein MesloDRAFT_1175 [Mesorhizobium japonicum R7A]